MKSDSTNDIYAPSTPSMQAQLRQYFARPEQTEPAPLTHAREQDTSANNPAIRYREASVLVPIHFDAHAPSIILTLRTAHLSSHAGQVSFPGGTREAFDNSPVHTALRESHEEIGLSPEKVEILGRLGSFDMPSGYRVTPVVGLISDIACLRPCPDEVAEIIHLPLHVALNPDSYQSTIFSRGGIDRQVWEVFIEEHRVWGATASILRHLAQEIKQANETATP